MLLKHIQEKTKKDPTYTPLHAFPIQTCSSSFPAVQVSLRMVESSTSCGATNSQCFECEHLYLGQQSAFHLSEIIVVPGRMNCFKMGNITSRERLPKILFRKHLFVPLITPPSVQRYPPQGLPFGLPLESLHFLSLPILLPLLPFLLPAQ